MFVAGSPRVISAEKAAEIRHSAPLEWTGVFADQPAESIAHLAGTLRLSAVQLHGQEDAAAVAEVRARVPEDCEVWKAVPVTGAVPFRAGTGADRLLLDGFAPGALGGTGARFDWSLLENYPERRTIVLAGGLDMSNVPGAAALEPWALDLSSGVESAPGLKDPAKLRAFFSARRRMPGRGDDTR